MEIPTHPYQALYLLSLSGKKNDFLPPIPEEERKKEDRVEDFREEERQSHRDNKLHILNHLQQKQQILTL